MFIDPNKYYAGEYLSKGTVTVENNRGTYTVSSVSVDDVIADAIRAGDSMLASIDYLLERLSNSAGIDVPEDADSLVELATIVAFVESQSARR
jgi:hypothetical protein